MEPSNFFQYVGNISGVFPGVVFQAVAFPLDQILKSASEHPTVNDFLYNIFLFAVYKFWQ